MNIVYIPHTAIIIEPSLEKAKEVKAKLGKLKERKIIIINIHDLARQFLNNELTPIEKLRELINDSNYSNYLKIFHNCTKEDFDGMLLAFSLYERDDVDYISGELGFRNIADCYNKYFFKDFPSNVLVSKRDGSYGHEL